MWGKWQLPFGGRPTANELLAMAAANNYSEPRPESLDRLRLWARMDSAKVRVCSFLSRKFFR